ncbi:MAG: hypothetical protein AB8B96_07015 [Lysobacterales bacterium]
MLLLSTVTAFVVAQPVFGQSVILALDDGPCAVPLQVDSSVTVDAATGNLILDVDDNDLPTCFGSPGGAIVVDLTVTPTTVDDGDTVTASWSATGISEATNCTATGGTAAWRTDFAASPSGGSGTYTPDTSTTFSITCENTDTDDVAVTVTGTGPPTGGADGFPPPPSFCGTQPAGRTLPINTFRAQFSNPPNGQSKRNFDEVWGPYPGETATSVNIPRNTYVALPFYADLPIGTELNMNWVGGPTNGGATQVSISRCPGDFNGVGYDSFRCLVNSGTEGGEILTIIGSGNACPLESGPTQQYYLNVRHTDSTGQNQCNDGASCAFLGIP